ncbi:hypothetical protein GE09DRAFT_738462 [Coniochaeta sp. 2T2.1]|nr:hypothetical protein GE09DRAFT_738462 [Coniochaeta sp. 2T2.1]
MPTQQDLQELLRLLTVSRKVPMIQAMSQIKSLQAVGLKSIKDIADAEQPVVQSAIKDEKQSKALHSACKAVLKRGSVGGKRDASLSTSESSSSKRTKMSSDTNDLLPGLNQQEQLSPQELEASLALPVNMDEELISRTTLQTNRAPLVLAFAVELLRYTMPEQPPSSRLSLGQAVVSANSRSKAVSLGIEKGPSAEDEGWGTGQPKVRIMGRDVAVLKRGGYEWKGEEEVGTEDACAGIEEPKPAEPPKTHPFFLPKPEPEPAPSSPVWSTSQPVSLKSSTFVGRATTITSPSQRQALISSLMTSIPHLTTATHNAWAYRTTDSRTGYVTEKSEDDGETGAGALLLRTMRDLGATDTLVVMTRWYGGIMLGPDRWRLMRNVVTSALTERLRKSGTEVTLGGEAVWGLDLEGMKGKANSSGGAGRQTGGSSVVGMQIHSPQGARAYLLKSFASAAPAQEKAGEDGGGAESPSKAKKPAKRTVKELDKEKEENLGLLFGALRLLFDSWADHLSPADLDRRAWSWYVAVRPEVDVGPSGWGAKGVLKLEDILKLRRKENTS